MDIVQAALFDLMPSNPGYTAEKSLDGKHKGSISVN